MESTELNRLLAAIDGLRDAVDRLGARYGQLKRTECAR